MKLDKFVTFLYANPNETGKIKKMLMKIMIGGIINTEINIQDLITKYKKINAD